MEEGIFLRNCWYVAASLSEFDDQNVVSRTILDVPTLLYRGVSGTYSALLDRCPHRLVPLSAGRRIGDTIQCGYHGLIFERDGRCSHIPGQDQIPASLRAKSFPVVARHGFLWIWIGEAESDPDLIPYLPWPDQNEWGFVEGYTWFGADYRLLTDNLLDLSHENYIHGRTIGNEDEESIAHFQPRVSSHGNLVSVHREMANIAPPPFFRMMTGSDERIDRWQTAIWTAPSINLTDVGARSAKDPDAPANVSHVLHLLTPETASSTHYFWGQCRNARIDDEELSVDITEALRRTFDEDKEMLELQQREIARTGAGIPQVAIAVDNGPLRARRILSTLIRREEQGEPTIIKEQRLLLKAGSSLEIEG